MQIPGFIVLLVAVVISRSINERGNRTLKPDEKLRLMDGFSATRMYSMVPLLALVAAFWFLLTKTEVNKRVVTMCYFGLLALYVVVRTILNQKKLTTLEMPQQYRRSFMIAQAISLVGVAWFFYSVF